MEISFSPRAILGTVRCHSLFFQIVPKGIHISDVKYDATPRGAWVSALKVDDRVFGTCNAQRTKVRIRPAVENFHSQHISIKLQGSFHVSDAQGNGRKLLNTCHSASSLSHGAFVFVFSATESESNGEADGSRKRRNLQTKGQNNKMVYPER